MHLEAVADINGHVRFGAFKFRYLHIFACFIEGSFQFADGVVAFSAFRKIGVGITCNDPALAFQFKYVLAFIASPARERGAFVDELTLPLPGEILGPGR